VIVLFPSFIKGSKGRIFRLHLNLEVFSSFFKSSLSDLAATRWLVVDIGPLKIDDVTLPFSPFRFSAPGLSTGQARDPRYSCHGFI